jgi:hypothetical protein
MKIRVERDTSYSYYLLDAEYLAIIDPDSYYNTITVSDEFVAKYRALQKLNNEMQDALKAIHDESFRTVYKAI